MYGTFPSGGDGGDGGLLATTGEDGMNGTYQGYEGIPNKKPTVGGGGGGGGGGDADVPNKKPAKGGGFGGTGAGGGETDGQGGNARVTSGGGGGGAFMLVASQGVTFSGTGEYGTGQGAVFGTFANTGSFPDGLPSVNSYATWTSLTAGDYYVGGGAGGGGAGGAGMGPQTATFTTASAPSIASPGGGIYTNGGALTLTPSGPLSNQAVANSAIQQGLSVTGVLPGVFGTDLIRISQFLTEANAGAAVLGTTAVFSQPTGVGNLPTLAQLLGSNMAGSNLGPLGGSLLNNAKFQHQSLDAVYADGMDGPLSSVLDMSL